MIGHGRIGFAVGTGRCGTLFLYEVMAQEPDVASSHERNPENEAFHRYCKWHRLPVDDEGFLATKQREIEGDLAGHAYSFEASPYVSLSVGELHARFGAKFVFLLRRPDRVVTSFVHKGFYRRAYHVGDAALAPGFQDQSPERFFTFFARISPRGDQFRPWNAMTQVGKVAWFWNAFNERTLEALERLPGESYRVVRIEDLDHAAYLQLCGFLGVKANVGADQFESLRQSKPHAFWRKRNIDQWTETEICEFEDQVEPLAKRFGYEYRVERLMDEARAERDESLRLGRIPQPKAAPRLWRARQSVAAWLNVMAKAVDPS